MLIPAALLRLGWCATVEEILLTNNQKPHSSTVRLFTIADCMIDTEPAEHYEASQGKSSKDYITRLIVGELFEPEGDRDRSLAQRRVDMYRKAKSCGAEKL